MPVKFSSFGKVRGFWLPKTTSSESLCTMVLPLRSGRSFGAHLLQCQNSIKGRRVLLIEDPVVTMSRFFRTDNSGFQVVDTVCSWVRKDGNWDRIGASLRDVNLDGSLVERILLEFKDPVDAKRALRFFHLSAQCGNVEHHVQSYCIIVQILVRARLLVDARALLESVIMKKVEDGSSGRVIVDSLLRTYDTTHSSPFLFNFLIQTCATLRLPETAFEAALYLEEQGFSFSLITFNKLAHVAQKSGKKELVWKIYEHMVVRRTYPNETTIRIMVNAMCNEGTLQNIVDMLDKIHGKRCTPMVVVNTSLIFKIFEENRVDEGTLLLNRLVQKNMILDDVAYTLIVYGHCKGGNSNAVHESYEEMTRRGGCKNSFLYTLFIKIHCEKGTIEEASLLMQEMKLDGLKPYAQTYNLLVEACSKAGRVEESLEWLKEMLERGFVPSAVACNEMLKKMCEVGNVQKANSVLTVLLDKGFNPTEETYSYLMDGYGRIGNVQEVLKVYFEMQYAGPPPGLMAYTSLIGSLCQCRRVGEAEKYLTAMEEKALIPTVSIYEMLMLVHYEEGNVEKLLSLHNQMTQRGIKPDCSNKSCC